MKTILMTRCERLETNLFQLFVHPENSDRFSVNSVIIFEVNIGTEINITGNNFLV